MDEKKEAVVVAEPVVEAVVETPDPLKVAQEKLAKAEEERDNYKAVALKRLGKLPGDAEFLDKEGNGELTVAEQVRIALLDREVESARTAREAEIVRLAKENSELKLILKNRPGASIGSGGGESPEVKDNVFSEAQLTELRARATRLKVDPDTFIENAKKNLQARR